MKYYLAEFTQATPYNERRHTEIVHLEKSPFQTAKVINGGMFRCDSCTAGYDSEEDLRLKAKIPDAPCKICGQIYSTTTSIGNYLRQEHICFHCNFWTEYVSKKDNLQIVRVNGKHYWANKSSEGDTRYNGFGGQKWHIKWSDGRELETNDLWSQGPIPRHFRDQLPDNAVFLPINQKVTA